MAEDIHMQIQEIKKRLNERKSKIKLTRNKAIMLIALFGIGIQMLFLQIARKLYNNNLAYKFGTKELSFKDIYIIAFIVNILTHEFDIKDALKDID